jgi:hypothetical protein
VSTNDNGRAPPLPAIIREGERDKWLASFAGSMRRYGASADAIFEALDIENEKRCRPPKSEKSLWRIARSIARYPSSATPEEVSRDKKLYDLNERYAVVQIGKDALILQRSPDDKAYELLTERAFRLLMRNRSVAVESKTEGETRQMPLAERWLAWSERAEYPGGLVFKPGEQVVPPQEFNLWRGWNVEPVGPGRCGLFRRHLLTVVCGGNARHYEWLLDWLADIVKHPMRKLGHVVALRGAQGVGKSVVGQVMQRILGVYQVVVEKPEQVVGRFNAHMERCLLVQAEEAFWGGDKRARGVLKHLVTSPTLLIERKGIDAVSRPNYTRLLITSNEDWVWPTELGDRRLVIFDVKPTYRGDVRYFDALFAEIDDGGAAAFLRFLLARKIDAQRLKVPPTTRALEDQAVLTMPADEAWLRRLLIEGLLPPSARVDGSGYAHVPFGALYERYVASVPRGQFVRSEEQFGVFLSQQLPPSQKVAYGGVHRFANARHETVQSRGRVLWPLAACRRRYSQRGRGAPRAWRNPPRWRIAK